MVAGPGARNGLRKIFPKAETTEELKFMRLLRDMCNPIGPTSGFTALSLEFPAFLGKPLSLKNLEHSLCEFSKYFGHATGAKVRERAYKSRSADNQGGGKCKVCQEVFNQGVQKPKCTCIVCGGVFHQQCDRGWSVRHHNLCEQCHEWEMAWLEIEDLDFEEEDEDDRPAKKRKQERKKKREVECVDLASDEDDGEEIHSEDSLAFDVIYI